MTRHTTIHQLMASRRLGGAAVIAMDLARASLRRGWNAVTWVPGPGPAADAVAHSGLVHRTIELQATDGRSHTRLLTCGRLFAGLRRGDAIVHVHGGFMWGLVRPALAAAGARTIVHMHLEPGEAEIRWVLKRPPAHIVTCAEYIARQMAGAVTAHGLTVPVTAVPNAIDTARFRPGDRSAARERLAIGAPDAFVMLMLANLSPHKGQSTTIRALERLRAAGVNAECWLAGEDREGRGAYLRELQALAAGLGVTDRVRFLGFRTDAVDLLQAADAFVLPSEHEGLPLSVLEAQAVGLPVVASDIPGVQEVVADGRTGFVVPAGDFGGYANRLADIATRSDIRNGLRTAALDYVHREHSWDVFEQRMFDVYEQVASGRRAS